MGRERRGGVIEADFCDGGTEASRPAVSAGAKCSPESDPKKTCIFLLTHYMTGPILPVVRLHGKTGKTTERKGIAWIIGAFLLCPCHLTLTLWLATTLLAGTAWGTFLPAHEHVAGATITLMWLAATAYGIRQILTARQARAEKGPWSGHSPRGEGGPECEETPVLQGSRQR